MTVSIQDANLSDITEKHNCYPIALASIVGSHNYGIALPESDLDVKIAYIPKFEEFYRGSFVKTQVLTDYLDYTIHPLHQVVEQIAKGNISFIEMLYPRNRDYIHVMDSQMVDELCFDLRSLVELSPLALFRSTCGVAQNKFNNRFKYTEKTAKYESLYGYNVKEMAHAIRVLEIFFEYYTDTGKLNFRNPPEFVSEILRGEWTLGGAVCAYENVNKLCGDIKYDVKKYDESLTYAREPLRKKIDYTVLELSKVYCV